MKTAIDLLDEMIREGGKEYNYGYVNALQEAKQRIQALPSCGCQENDGAGQKQESIEEILESMPKEILLFRTGIGKWVAQIVQYDGYGIMLREMISEAGGETPREALLSLRKKLSDNQS